MWFYRSRYFSKYRPKKGRKSSRNEFNSFVLPELRIEKMRKSSIDILFIFL
jgi:hypothetical protein